jgi:hypothetical protein
MFSTKPSFTCSNKVSFIFRGLMRRASADLLEDLLGFEGAIILSYAGMIRPIRWVAP